MTFWIVCAAALVVLLALAWWSDRRKRGRVTRLARGDPDELAARHQTDRGLGTIQGQASRDSLGGGLYNG